MDPLHQAKTCELHVHPGGCLTAEDLIELGKDCYEQVDWTLFVKSYENAFGVRPDLITLYRDALADPAEGLERFKQHYIYTEKDGGDFGRFQAKFNLILCLLRHFENRLERLEKSMQCVVDRHQSEGIHFVEYRCGSSEETAEGFLAFHHSQARVLASQKGMTARYIISLRRWAAEQDYQWVQRLMRAYPELVPVIVGVDFAHFEEGYPPKDQRALFEQIKHDNGEYPQCALEITYHVGESYFDKSLESAIRWCHEIAQMGAKRLGHATALGLDPEVAVARRPNAHTHELLSERLDQIAYDLVHAAELENSGIEVDAEALEQEQQVLKKRASDDRIERPYDAQRLQDIRKRQKYVLDCLTQLGTVIETCPTSNLRIGGVPDPSHSPIHTFLKSNVNLVIGADDPGIFDSPLANEIDWILTHANWTAEALEKRLGDPRRFQLGSLRPI